MLACISFAANTDTHAVFNTCWDVDFYNLITFYDTITAAVLTLVLDDSAFSMTVWTWDLGLHHAEHRANGLDSISSTITCMACFWLCTAFASCTMTFLTSNILANFEFLGNTCGNFLQSEFYFHAQIASLILLASTAATKTSAKSAETSAVSSEDVSKHGEDVIHIHVATSAKSTESTLWTVESELVILLALLRIS